MRFIFRPYMSPLYSNKPIGKQRSRLGPAKVLILGYLTAMLVGAGLLSLPMAQQADAQVSWLTALFTSASAVSGTGLSVVSTGTTWSPLGLVVILLLLQVAALGFMVFSTLFFALLHKKMGLSQRMLIRQSLDLHDFHDLNTIMMHILAGALLFQLGGGVLLMLRFVPRYGWLEGMGMAIFTAVSAFANGGFDVFSHLYPEAGFSIMSGDFFALSVIMVLTLLGGLGFFVWEDCYSNRFRFKKLQLHSKLVLLISVWLLVIPALLFYGLERTNTLAGMSLGHGWFTSLFQVIMPRSTGFSLIEQSELTGATKMVVMMLMFVGGSGGSAAGGIRNVTAGILLLSGISYLRGKQSLVIMKKTIPLGQIKGALAIVMIAVLLTFTSSLLIAMVQPELSFTAILFEVISAVSTSGLSYGSVADFGTVGQLVLIGLMFLGRVGIMTLAMVAFAKTDKYDKIKYPETWVILG